MADSNSIADENDDIFINETDGLPDEHPSLPSEYTEQEHNDFDSDVLDDLPTSLIVTNIQSDVFVNDDMKKEMEELFREFSPHVTFHWLKSFRRLRVNYENAITAASARIQLHQFDFNNSQINCYFAQPVTPVSNVNLKLPAPYKNYLISPPSSPPAGWEQCHESEPIVNYDLLAALENLTPGETHEVHPPTCNQPGIVVHTAKIPEEAELELDAGQKNLRIVQTRRPEIM
jgi:calcipressin-2